MGITVQNIRKRFGSYRALDGVSLEVPSGGHLALVGPSDSGKTTLLRIIAGLESPDEGAVLHEGQEITHCSPGRRGFGFVFQHDALFHHMNVRDNVAFALRVRRAPRTMVHDRVDELLRRIRLEGSAHRYPSQLSRGQRQRVALARALATEPKVLLLDAPFAALAAPVRKDLWQWLRRLQDELGITSIFVTHDQEEAFAVADRVIHLKEGRIEPSEASAEDLDPAPCFLPFPGRVTSSRGGRCGLRQRSSSW